MPSTEYVGVGEVAIAKTEKDDVIVVKDEGASEFSAPSLAMTSERMDDEDVDHKATSATPIPLDVPISGPTPSFAPSSGSAFSSVSKAVKKTQQQVQQHLHPSALSSYYSTSSSSAPGGGAYYLGWNRLQEQLRNQQVFVLSLRMFVRVCVCFVRVCLCLCVRERQRERERE